MKTVIGDITTVQSGIILQQVNCQGVMNSGVAKAIRNKYPEVYNQYKNFCNKTTPDKLLGEIQFIRVTDDIAVVNLFSQLNYGYDKSQFTDYEALDLCLEKLAIAVERSPKPKIHHPKIGAGLGGGDWNIIKKTIEKHLGETTLWIL